MYSLSHWKWDVLSPIAGILLTLSFAPFNYWPLGFIAVLYGFYFWTDIVASKALLRGFLFGLGYFGSGVSWVYVSVHDYGGAPVAGAVMLTVFCAAFWALFPAVTAYSFAKVSHFNKTASYINIVALPGIWILIEYFRGFWLLNGFPWLQVGYAQMDNWLAGYIPLIGGYGVGFLFLVTVAVCADSLKKKRIERINLIAVVGLWLVGFWVGGIDWVEPAGQPLKVTLVQGNVAQDKKWLPEYRLKTLVDYEQLTGQHWDSDVIIWPETAIPAFYHQVQEFYLGPLAKKAKDSNTDLIVSLPAKGKTNNENYNLVVTLGRHSGEYRKSHLLPFGEYLPLQPLSGFILDLLQVSLGNFLPGDDSQPLMTAGGYKFATSICYEDAFSTVFLNKLPQAAYLINVTNDAWFGDSLEPHQHMQIARMRSIESGRYLLRVTNTGITAIVNEKGRVIKQAPMFTQIAMTDYMVPMKGRTPFSYIGDVSVITVISLVSIVLIFLYRKMLKDAQ
jgi:apolipoprotein N-acyltransferase